MQSKIAEHLKRRKLSEQSSDSAQTVPIGGHCGYMKKGPADARPFFFVLWSAGEFSAKIRNRGMSIFPKEKGRLSADWPEDQSPVAVRQNFPEGNSF